MVYQPRTIANRVTVENNAASRHAQSMTQMEPFLVSREDTDFGDMLAIIVRVAVLSLTGLIYAATALRYVSPATSVYKLFVFAAVATIIPFSVGAAIHFSKRRAWDLRETAFQSCELLVIVAALLFVGASLLMHLPRVDPGTWSVLVRWMLVALVGLHLAFLTTIYIAPQLWYERALPAWQKIITWRGAVSRPTALACLISAAMLLLFRVEPKNNLLNVVFSGVFDLDPKIGWEGLIAAPIVVVLVLLTTFRLVQFEATCAVTRPLLLHRLQRITLALTIPAIFFWYFDFTFSSDALHFLTNVGPASQIIRGGAVPMVTAFSQYGPGPLLATWLTFLIVSPSFQAANILSQLHSLTFYAVILMCLFGMTRHRMAALVLGFAAIGVVLAGWWGGNSSLNTVPSSMGLRYLPNALLVLSISFLGKDRSVSPCVFLSMFLSSIWSYESLLGSVAILGLFFLVLAQRNRSVRGLFNGVFVGIIFPVVASVVFMSVMTLVWSGKLPDYPAYLNFALTYNPTSDFWSLAGDGSFLGWIIFAVAGMTVLSLAWLTALGGRDGIYPWDSELLIYRFVPMAGLVAFMSSYFVGRSVDFTLIIAFLPMAALIIPAILKAFSLAPSGQRQVRYIAVIAGLAAFFPLTFSIAALYRGGSPYAVALQECLNEHVCSPGGLMALIATRYPLRPMIDQRADPAYFDQSGLTTEAIDLINTYAADNKQIALFLGIHPTTIWSVHTNAVLMLVGKGHRWPFSYVLSDEINSTLRRSIINADVKLKEGEPVFIRTDESRLGELEGAIVRKLRTEVQLCPLPGENTMVSAYRATWRPTC